MSEGGGSRRAASARRYKLIHAPYSSSCCRHWCRAAVTGVVGRELELELELAFMLVVLVLVLVLVLVFPLPLSQLLAPSMCTKAV